VRSGKEFCSLWRLRSARFPHGSWGNAVPKALSGPLGKSVAKWPETLIHSPLLFSSVKRQSLGKA
jgi:hypothetical protein